MVSKADLPICKTVKTVFSIDWSAEEWKFGKEGPICRKFDLTRKPDKLVYFCFAFDPNEIDEFRLSFYMLSKADLPICKAVKIVFL